MVFALVLHFLKGLFPPYSLNYEIHLRDSWFINICGANIALFPFILISKNKNLSNIELILVADGMGGLENGARASNIVAYEMFKWFNSLTKNDLNNIEILKNKIKNKSLQIDDEIRTKCGTGGTTMVSALILFDRLLITNIGDSRAYTFDGNLKQITTDHSTTQRLYEQGEIEKIDDMRFHKKNNLILSRLGCEKRLLEIDFYELDKDSIDYLFLFSDGITDLISNERMETIIKNNGDIGNNIIEEVLTQDAYSKKLNSNDYYDKLEAGRDNASLILKRRR